MDDQFTNKLINERGAKIGKVQESLYLLFLGMVMNKYKQLKDERGLFGINKKPRFQTEVTTNLHPFGFLLVQNKDKINYANRRTNNK